MEMFEDSLRRKTVATRREGGEGKARRGGLHLTHLGGVG